MCLSSKRTLEQLCEDKQDMPILTGIGRLTISGIQGTIAAGCAFVGRVGIYEFRDGINNADEWYGALCIFPLSILGVLGLSFLAGKNIVGGVGSVFKPLLKKNEDGAVYMVNGGFTTKHTVIDRYLGKIVVPIDNPEELQQITGRVLMNGVKVVNAYRDSFVSHRGVEYVCGDFIKTIEITHSVNLEFDFKGEIICHGMTSTIESEVITFKELYPVGSRHCMIADYKKGCNLNIVRMLDAL